MTIASASAAVPAAPSPLAASPAPAAILAAAHHLLPHLERGQPVDAATLRGAMEAVPPNTRRAARSLGLSWVQDMRYIALPLASRVALPSWIGLALGVMKDSALVYVVQVTELMKSTKDLITRLQEPLFLLLLCGVFYFVISFPIARFGAYLEKRWSND